MNFLKNVTAKQLWMYIGGAFVFNLILRHILQDPLIDGLQAFYMAMPTALQKLLYSASGSLAQLDPTPLELSVLFAIGAVEKLGMLIELSMIGALLWLAYMGVSKFWTKSKTADEK